MRTLAHLSDLHFGHSAANDAACAGLARSLAHAGVDHVVVTGDLTHTGRREQIDAFRRAFAPLAAAGRLTVIPGNHDRMGHDVARQLMPGPRVEARLAPGLFLVRVDSTGPHNRSRIAGHGRFDADDLVRCEAALRAAPPDALVVVLVHHHLVPLPEEDVAERIASYLRRPWAAELPRGRRILSALRGRCDLVLHGHRHHPSELILGRTSARPLGVYNAGATPRLGCVRIFRHANGRPVGAPQWLDVTLPIAPQIAAGIEPAPTFA